MILRFKRLRVWEYVRNSSFQKPKNQSQFDLIFANDEETWPIADKLRKLNPATKLVFDAHEYYLGQFNDQLSWSLFHKWYSEYLCETYPKTSNFFCLGVGNPAFRENLFILLEQAGGIFKPLLADSSFLSHSAIGQFDAMPFSFVGPETSIGRGVLINTRAHVHHECKVGDFSDVGPGAMLLGNSQAGKHCRIGAGAVLLPGIKIGDDVIVGAGAVVTKNFDSGSKIAGIPARMLTTNKNVN